VFLLLQCAFAVATTHYLSSQTSLDNQILSIDDDLQIFGDLL